MFVIFPIKLNFLRYNANRNEELVDWDQRRRQIKIDCRVILIVNNSDINENVSKITGIVLESQFQKYLWLQYELCNMYHNIDLISFKVSY